MALHPIRSIGMNEAQMAEIERLIKANPLFERSGLSATGTADDATIEALEALGIFIEKLPDSDTPISLHWLEPRASENALRQMDAAFEPALNTPLGRLARRGTHYYLLQFQTDLTASDRADLERLGITLGEYVPDFAYKAALTAEQHAAVVNLGSLRRVVQYDLAMTTRALGVQEKPIDWGVHEPMFASVELDFPGIRERTLNILGMHDAFEIDAEPAMYNIGCHNSEDLDALAAALEDDPRVERVERGRYRLRITLERSANAGEVAMEIGALPQVSTIEPFEYPSPDCDFVRQVIALDNAATGGPTLPWNGAGQRIGVIDSGVDIAHPDLAGRVDLVERVAPEAPNDPAGHGTHVCGIIAGNGNASGGRVRGVAPDANLLVHAIRDANGRFSGLGVDYGPVFDEIYQKGVRVLNCSWGTANNARYTTDALEMDMFVFEHPDMLVIVAAGNDGQQPNPLLPTDPLGKIGYNSITSPATAKNVLTVGASCSSRNDGPYVQRNTWGQYPGKNPPPQHPPLSQEPITGDAMVMAAFSSRGPTDDTRIKPDLVAPGTAILAARSGPSAPKFPEPAFNDHYCYNSGTSMAAPVVAGAAALVRQFYIEDRGHAQPSAALLKATLINGAQWIPIETAQDNSVGKPNFHQGFGRLDLSRSLPMPDGSSGFSLHFIDISRGDPQALASNEAGHPNLGAGHWQKRVRVDADHALRLTLCWTDSPAPGLQNRLSLIVISPSGRQFTGNEGMNRLPWQKSDPYNNTARIEIETPEPGNWTVKVNADRTVAPFRKQGFSLVITGKVSDFF